MNDEMQDIKKQIEWYELNTTGLRQINGGDARAINIRPFKRKSMVRADIILTTEDSYERHNNCEYHFDFKTNKIRPTMKEAKP